VLLPEDHSNAGAVSFEGASDRKSSAAGAVLELDGVVRRYGGTTALDRVSLTLAGNEYVSLLGPSGSGKTVLLRVIAGFEEPDAGAILFKGRSIAGVPAHKRGIGFVFQNFALFPHLSVYDNIAFGLTNRADRPITDKAKVRKTVRDMVELVGLAGLENRGVHQISGGQRQRVALARTLVAEPNLVLLDEPLGALDANLRNRMRGELRRIREKLAVTFLHVTGSESEALAIGDRVVVLDNGHVGQFDRPDEIYNRPANPNVARFLNCYNIFSGTVADGGFASAAGIFPVTRLRKTSTGPAYAIRRDLVAIRPAGQERGPGQAGVESVFLASEYSGSAITYFFELAGGQVVEVENHLSHRKPEELSPKAPYSLIWSVDDAVVFA